MIHRFIVKYILIAPLNISQSDMSYFFETSHEHFVRSIERKSPEIFDYSIKGDGHVSRSSKAVYECKIVNSQKRRANSLTVSHLATGVANRFGFTCSRTVITFSNTPFWCDMFDVMEEQARQAVRRARAAQHD